MKKLILLLLLAVPVTAYEPLYNINAYILTSKRGVNKIVKKLIPNTTNYKWIQDQTFLYNNKTSSGTTYVHVNIRLEDEALRDKILVQMVLDWDTYESQIDAGSYIRWHTCYNNQGGQCCEEVTERSK